MDDINKLKLTCGMIDRIYICIIHTKVCRTQIFIVSGHLHAADMGTEASLSHISPALVEYLVCNSAEGSVILKSEHSYLTVMVACHKQKLIIIIRRQITASHTVYGCLTKEFQCSVILNLISLYTKVRDGIKIFPVMCNGYIA